ncbi:hypothetical protein ACNR90_000089 [Candidozyma auris]
MQACTRDLKIIKEKVQSSFPVFYEANEHLRMSRANDIELSQEEIIEISEITDAYNKLIEERTQKAIDALAYCFIRNVKVIRNRAHFTNCKDKRIFRLFEDSLDADITDDIKVIDEDSVSKRISEILTEKDLFLPDDSGRFFNLRRNPVTSTNFLWVTVRYTSDLENCKTFYARNFLLPEDVILEWRVNNTPPRQGLLEADVIIQLSSNRIPPKFIRGLTRELHAQKQWEEHPVAMLNGIQIVQIENPKDHAEARLAESLEQLRATCTMFMERRAMATQTNFLSRPRKANEQAFYMTIGEGFAQIQSTPTQVDTDIDSPSSTPFIGAQQARITESFSSYTEDTLVFQDAEENIASMSSDENSTIPSRQPPDSQQQPEVINTQSTISPAGTLVTSSGHHIQLGTPKDVPEMEVTQIDSETSSEDEHIGLRTRSKLQQKPESPRQSGTPTEGMTSAGLRRSARLNPHLAQSNHDQNL